MGQPLDPLNGRLVAYDDQLLDLKRQSVDRFCLRFFGCEMGKKAGLAATVLGFWGLIRRIDDLRHTLTRERRRRS